MYSEKPLLHARQKEFRSGNLRTIALDTTPLCNMKCEHCYAETFANAEPVELGALERAMSEVHDMGVFHYVLQGGEPVVDPARLQAVIAMTPPDECYINVVSNGWDMTPERIRWLKSLKVDKIAFSLDSGIEEEHDRRRGAGSHKRVLAAIDNVLAAGLLTSVSIVVTRTSLYSEGFRKAYDYAKSKGIRMDVQIGEPVGKWDGRRDFLMRPEDSAYIKKMQLDGPVLKNGQHMINRDIFSGEQDHCPAGTEFMGISCDGNILACNFLQYTLGNIRDVSIKAMREKLLKNRWFSGRHPVCLVGEDDEFINTYVMPYVGEPKPLDAHTIFGLE